MDILILALILVAVLILLWPVKHKEPVRPRLPEDKEPRDCGECDRLTGCMMAGNNLAPCNMYLPKGCMKIGNERRKDSSRHPSAQSEPSLARPR